MRLKAFLLSFVLFAGILFAALGTMSAFMTRSQMELLREKSIREYHSLTETLVRDMAALYHRSEDFTEALNGLVEGYRRHYSQHQIRIGIVEEEGAAAEGGGLQLTHQDMEGRSLLLLAGRLPEPFERYRLDYEADITDSILNLAANQRQLLTIAVAFSVVSFFLLYFIFGYIFQPLKIVAASSGKIADGHYGERIPVRGGKELATLARDFNRMALTIEKQIQELEDEAMMKQRFVDNFAHETRTPLTAILGYAEYIQNAPLSEAQILDLMPYIMSEAVHMQKLGDSLLELATLRDYQPVKAAVPIARLFEETRHSLKTALEEQDVQLEYSENGEFLEGQEDLLKSLMINLAGNAIKACQPGAGKVVLTVEPRELELVVSVSDNGCGIPQEDLMKVTDPFFRVDKARSRKDGGTGLGLSLCKQITQIHGGEMIIESRLGAGTKVKIYFNRPHTFKTFSE